MPKHFETSNSPRVWQPVKLGGSYTVDWEMAEPVLRVRPRFQIMDERINDLSPLWPESHFRDFTMMCAKRFVGDMEKKRSRYRLLTPEADLVIRGPFQHRDLSGRAVGFAQDEWLFPECVDFQIAGTFVAEYGFNVEHGDGGIEDATVDTAKVQAVSYAAWLLAETKAQQLLRRS